MIENILTLQENHYYPFGMQFMGSEIQAGNNNYLYNLPAQSTDKRRQAGGKEQQSDFNLHWYDYGARFYDQQLGRWHVIDNKAEKYNTITSYAYALNNPILFLDPDGNDVKVSTTQNKETGKKTVTFTVTMSVKNNTRFSNKTVMSHANGVKNQIEKSYSGYNSKSNTEYVTNVVFDKAEKNYILSFTNEVDGASSLWTSGRTDEIGNTTENRMQVVLDGSGSGESNQTIEETSRTGAHEYGHSLGLRHGGDTKGQGSVLSSKDEDNLMNVSKYTKSTDTNTEQLKKAQKTAERDQEIKIKKANNDKYSKNHY